MFVKALRDDKDNGYAPARLQWLVLQILKNEGITDACQLGVIVGFFSELDSWLRFAAKHGGSKLDEYPYSHFTDEIEKLRVGV